MRVGAEPQFSSVVRRSFHRIHELPTRAPTLRNIRPDVPSGLTKIHESAAANRPYQLLLTDAVLPGVDVEACRRIAEEELGASFRVRPYNEVG